jgi:hypothetical protein
MTKAILYDTMSELGALLMQAQAIGDQIFIERLTAAHANVRSLWEAA